MDTAVTEKNYPVEGIWVFKSLLGSLFSIVILIPIYLFSNVDSDVGFYLVLTVVFALFYVVLSYLRMKTFHFSIDSQFLTLKQGIVSKQERHIPYGVIQNIYVKQDLFDRLLNLASLTLENAAEGGRNRAEGQQKIFGITVNTKKKSQFEMVGFSGNKVSIPGLKKQNAEILKGIVLQKMKDNPIEDNQSGL